MTRVNYDVYRSNNFTVIIAITFGMLMGIIGGGGGGIYVVVLLLLNHIDENVLKIVICCVLVLSGLCSLFKVKSSGQNDNEIPKVVKKIPVTAPIGLLDFSPYLAVGITTIVSFVGNFLSISVLCLSSYLFHVSSMYIDVIPGIYLLHSILIGNLSKKATLNHG